MGPIQQENHRTTPMPGAENHNANACSMCLLLALMTSIPEKRTHQRMCVERDWMGTLYLWRLFSLNRYIASDY